MRVRREPRTSAVMRTAAAELASAASPDAVAGAVNRAVAQLVPPRHRPRVELAPPDEVAAATSPPAHRYLADAEAGEGPVQVGVLLVDPLTASRSRLRSALELLSAQAALALERLRLTEEIARRRQEDHLGTMAEQTADVVLVLDDTNRIRYASPSARTVFGTSLLEGVPLPELVEQAQRHSAESLLRHASAGDTGPSGQAARADWTVKARDGRTVNVEVSCRPLRDTGGDVVVTMRDATVQRQLEHELTRRAFRDPLTGLPDRTFFSERVGQAIATQTGLTAVLLVDPDNVTSINDDLGHRAGDTVLATLAHRIRETVGERGIAARLDDDRFAALIRDVADDEPDAVAAHLAEALAVPVPVAGGAVSCTVSIGVATSAGAATAREVIRHADLALRAAKAAGPGQRRRYHPSMADRYTDRVALRAALGRAVQEGALALEYQPVVELDTGRTVGFEALLRWHHPTRGVLPPGEFIEIAEDFGLIRRIGEWALRAAMTDARTWRAASRDPLYVSVNVSPQQLRAEGFVDTVFGLLATTGLEPGQLVIEVTERLLLRDEETVWHDLQQLRLRGIRVAIDDFGTGYSALSYLRQAPLDLVKLDRQFISPLAASTRQRELVAGIVTMAHSVNLDVIAEGIETEDQRSIAAVVGCRYGQGYLFARPMPDPTSYLASGRTPSRLAPI
jgi:diguanylate cyclase (GGDEF)-like protein/PAS domain S-box-containing protein